MKINVEVDLTPEEMRRFMGLPDMGIVHQQLLEQFTARLSASSEQRDEFMRTLMTGAFAPWQNFFNLVSGASGQAAGSKDNT
ncbi:MAG: DUF6489 family protein [Gammaproteobacteria bacterium]|nr:DUF6489 family protein [Gammaproteobacteria bacterium]MCY4198360.1 DUF6489 family protein [Gammaproteobacteria bacterium]MCY4278611.1 DUF6489 family protein [Gammaproteobacteria bacterium]MCY4324227.1 DUF6489 family protein [Gammaproteobacteria bacterium]